MTNKMKEKVKDESGSVAVLTALMLTVLLMIAAMALDFGALYIEESKIQTACDAAALAGASYLDGTASGETAARNAVESILNDNGVSIDDVTIEFDTDAEGTHTVKVTKKEDVKTKFASIMDIKTMKSKKSATASKGSGTAGPKEYAIFSGNKNDYLAFTTGEVTVSGNVHTNSSVNVSAKTTIDGSLDYNDTRGGATITGDLNTKGTNHAADNVDIQSLGYEPIINSHFPSDSEYLVPAGYNNFEDYYQTHKVDGKLTINEGDNVFFPDSYIELSGKTLIINGCVKISGFVGCGNGANLVINGSLFINNGMNIYGDGNFEIYGYLKIKNELNFTNTNNVKIGSDSPRRYGVIWSMEQGIDINGIFADTYGLFYAPKGEIKWNGNGHKLVGSLIGDRIGTNTGGLNVTLPQEDPDWEFGGKAGSTGSPGGSGKPKLIK